VVVLSNKWNSAAICAKPSVWTVCRSHTHVPQFQIAERGVRNGCASLLNALDLLGVNSDTFDKMLAWTLQHRSVSIGVVSEERCKFVKKASRDVEAATKSVTEVQGTIFGSGTIAHKNVTRVDEWFW
jgi:hypothetical protein